MEQIYSHAETPAVFIWLEVGRPQTQRAMDFLRHAGYQELFVRYNHGDRLGCAAAVLRAAADEAFVRPASEVWSLFRTKGGG